MNNGWWLIILVVLCWYWKINEVIVVLKSIESKLDTIEVVDENS